MHNKTIINLTNQENTTAIEVVQIDKIVNLGKATLLTLGYVGNLAEHSRPNAWTTGSTKI